MQMDAGLDTGPVLRQETTPIDTECDAGELHDRLADMSGRLLMEVAALLSTPLRWPRMTGKSGKLPMRRLKAVLWG